MNYLEDDGMNPEELLSSCRPDESFAQLIKRAISNSPRQRLFLTEIYSWIIDNYPYFKQIDPGWRNSVRHSLSTAKEFVRIKETRHRYNRGSEWCLAESNLGRWYLQLTEDDQSTSTSINNGNGNDNDNNRESLEFSRLIQLSTLIPELSSSMVPHSPERPILINLATCPDYLLGQVPHPELFVVNNRRTPSPQDAKNFQISAFNNQLPIKVSDAYLGSPLSRKASPKTWGMDLEAHFEDGSEYLDFN